LVSVTLTFVTDVAAPWDTLNGTVSWNTPPVGPDAALLNHVVKADVSGTVMAAIALPETVKVKLPLDTSRVLEEPLTTTLSPPETC